MSNFRVPYLVGTIKTRDHQYWPTILRSQLKTLVMSTASLSDLEADRFIQRGWPVPVDLRNILQTAWRVREWSVDAGSFEYSGVGDGGAWSMTGTWEEFSVKMQRVINPPDFPPTRDVRDERDMLGPFSDLSDNFAFHGSRTLRNAGTNDSVEMPCTVIDPIQNAGAPTDFTGGLEILLHGQYVIYDPDTELFYPGIVMFGNAIQLAGSATVRFYCLSSAPVVPDETTQGTFTIKNPTIGGPDILVPLGIRGAHTISSDPEGSGSVNVTMTPVAWWPFKNSLGQAVYDESDGHQINDPYA